MKTLSTALVLMATIVLLGGCSPSATTPADVNFTTDDSLTADVDSLIVEVEVDDEVVSDPAAVVPARPDEEDAADTEPSGDEFLQTNILASTN